MWVCHWLLFPPTQDMSLAEAEVHVLTILKQIMEEKLTSVNIQVGFHLCEVTPVCSECYCGMLAAREVVTLAVQVASVRSGEREEQKCFTVYSKERLEEIIAQIKK